MKNILRLLLSKFYSKQENELIAQQAMPSSSAISIPVTSTSVTTWQRVVSYTTPTNGYMNVKGQTNADRNFLQILAGDNTENPSITGCGSSAGQWTQITMPVAKGRNVDVWCDNISNISVFFSKSVGGGCRIFKKMQGGCVCLLKSSFNSLQRNSLLAKKDIFKHPISLTYLVQLVIIMILLRPRMDMLGPQLNVQKSHYPVIFKKVLTLSLKSVVLTLAGIQQHILKSQKVCKSLLDRITKQKEKWLTEYFILSNNSKEVLC